MTESQVSENKKVIRDRSKYFGHPLQIKLFLLTFLFFIFGIILGLVLQYIVVSQSEFGVVFVVMLLFIFVGSVYALLILKFSNQLLGPIFQIQKQLESRLKESTDRPISVREGDYFLDLVKTLNEILQKK